MLWSRKTDRGKCCLTLRFVALETCDAMVKMKIIDEGRKQLLRTFRFLPPQLLSLSDSLAASAS
jgi:hypothetical protein